jgi:CheY-like chemotaxis protein
MWSGVADRGGVTELRTQEGRILLVSAPGLDRELYVSALGAAGFAVDAQDSAPVATNWPATAEMPDVIVVDLLPEPERAWALVDRLTTRSRSVPVIIFTSLIRPDGANRRRARSLGCAAFVAKPARADSWSMWFHGCATASEDLRCLPMPSNQAVGSDRRPGYPACRPM